ncbi:MAG: hypothetical protein EPN97_12910 [Alphaproteobacteria bacterium]|nr:MAG: hypothetical protein EPN97_12910 [Alphaproteobacteria bacterium]
MTRHDEHHHKPAKRHTGNRPLRRRLFAGAVVLVCALAAFVTLFDRKDLPAGVRDNPYIARIYCERDAAIRATTAMLGLHGAEEAPADANADMKQLGYPKDDRAKLETIIGKGKTPE